MSDQIWRTRRLAGLRRILWFMMALSLIALPSSSWTAGATESGNGETPSQVSTETPDQEAPQVVVSLKDGSQLVGQIVETRPSELVLDTIFGEHRIPAKIIESVSSETDPMLEPWASGHEGSHILKYVGFGGVVALTLMLSAVLVVASAP